MVVIPIVAFFLVVMPIWLLAAQADKYLQTTRLMALRRRRYDTYTCIEQAIRETRRDLPVSQRLVLDGKTIPRSRARRIYAAQPGTKSWSEKASITELLERLDRLAVGVRVGALEADVWQRLAGYNVVSLCRILQNFVVVSREGREDRYASLSHVEEIFKEMMIREDQSPSNAGQFGASAGAG